MSWTAVEQSPSIVTRPLGPSELFLKLLSDAGHQIGREHWAVNYTATISPHGHLAALLDSPGLLPTLIRYSWLHLRFQHPSLAAHLDSSNTTNIVYSVPGSADVLSEWASQTFVIDTEAQSADEVISTIAPAPDARLYYVPKSNELLLHTAHWRMDGVSGILLLGQLVDLMVSHTDSVLSGNLPDPFNAFQWGSEVTRLAPSLEDAGNVPLTVGDKHKAIAYEAVGTFGLIPGAVGVPYTGDLSTLPSGTRTAEIKLSPATTSTIISAVKSRGLGITAAVQASLAAVNFQHAIPEHRGRHYTGSIRTSMRPYLPEPYSTPTMASAFYSTLWFAQAQASSSWEENARVFQTEYQKGISSDFLQAHREYVSTSIELIKSLPTPAEPPSEIDISSLGIMEQYLEREYGTPEGGISLMHVGFSVEMLSRQGGLFVWTFRDQLVLRLAYNEAFHTAEQMMEVLRDIQTDLLKQLQVY